MATKSKRLQIPISSADEQSVRRAAKLYQIPAAEWIRRVILKAAERDLAMMTEEKLSPLEALSALQKLAGPNDGITEILNDPRAPVRTEES